MVPGIAESSYGTQVAALAGIPHEICERAQAVAKEFALDSKSKQDMRTQSRIPVSTLSDFKFLTSISATIADEDDEEDGRKLLDQLEVVREQVNNLDGSGTREHMEIDGDTEMNQAETCT